MALYGDITSYRCYKVIDDVIFHAELELKMLIYYRLLVMVPSGVGSANS